MVLDYKVDRYRWIIERIRDPTPEASISADVIVAFPGKMNAQFRATCDLVDELSFDLGNTTAYSPRTNRLTFWPLQEQRFTVAGRRKPIGRLLMDEFVRMHAAAAGPS
jgi:tRNA-2-methylthio-N6-dimethylallyladenosine synthase